ncbi:universal stress protein [Streptomyces sp. B6B3]|uniref:universal stress protein n=1 Tax=Streptomyces sp. B6B3 TaxID=3153570 RepID=UPI00325C5AF5
MSRTLTAGLDNTPESLAAADWAAREAERRDLPLRLVHVHQPALRGPMPYPLPEERPEQLKETLEEAATDLRRRHPAVTITTEEIVGDPAKTLAALAGDSTDSDEDADTELLVLGSRGLGGLVGYLLGSVSLPTISHARRPVVAVRASERAAADSGDVLLGLDPKRPSDDVIAFAFDAAERRAATLRVVHGWTPSPRLGYAPEQFAPGLMDALQAEHVEALAATLRPWREARPQARVVEQVSQGSPAHQLVQAAASASLVVLGRRARHTPLTPRIGPITHALLHHSPTPVAVIPHA